MSVIADGRTAMFTDVPPCKGRVHRSCGRDLHNLIKQAHTVTEQTLQRMDRRPRHWA